MGEPAVLRGWRSRLQAGWPKRGLAPEARVSRIRSGPSSSVSHAGERDFFDEDPPKGGQGGISQRGEGAWGRALAQWWPLAALVVLAAALRLSTLDLQSFWYDEAYVPVHTLHASLAATLRSVEHRENTPPLWYVLIWGWSRIFGTGEVALRLPSALAGTATVAVAWGIGQQLVGRRAAIATAALVATNPLFVWYSQEARAYGLFVFLAALAMWCWLRADADPDGVPPARLAAFAASGAAALATHYFAVFLLAPMCLWLLRPRRIAGPGARPVGRNGNSRRRRVSPGFGPRSMPPRGVFAAVAAIAAVGAALVPLALAQGGHGTQWIGAWALASRLETIPQYYLTGYSGAPLGHGLELLVALEILAAVGYGLWRMLTPRESEAALLALGVAACGVLIPVAMAVAGADYLAPRNVVAAMVPLTAGIAVIAVARRTGRTGLALVGLIAVTFAALSIDVNLSPRLQRGDWRGLARAIKIESPPTRARAITTVELGSAPLEYYLPPLRNLRRGAAVTVSEIDETGYAPLRAGAGEPPAPGFHLTQYRDVHGLILYRFRSATPRTVSEAALRSHVIAAGRPEVLVR
jgi:mannosyltransferase